MNIVTYKIHKKKVTKDYFKYLICTPNYKMSPYVFVLSCWYTGYFSIFKSTYVYSALFL